VWQFFRSDEEGASIVEYALLIALVTAVCILAIGVLGTSIRDFLASASSSI
jgi:Flp pilus assembly pilin Flp